jgi:dienelactone hydrolase
MTYIPENMIGKPDGYPEKIAAPEIAKRFKRLLGKFETPSVPLNIKVIGETELPGGIVKQKIEYYVEPGESVPALHLFRKGLPGNAPGVLSIHGHGGDQIFPFGQEYHCHPKPDDPMQYSYIAALAGFRVLAPDALCFGERQSKFGYAVNFHDEIITHAELTGRGKSLAWKSVWDNSRAIEALESFGCASIGAIGWSGGSTQAYILASVNRKVKASVCFFSFATLRHQFYQYRCCHCLYHYIPGMIRAGIDWDQVVALIPPRKIFLAWGALDEGTPEPAYRAFADAIQRRCEKENFKDVLYLHEEPDKGHEITMPMLQNAIQFLKTSLS